MPMDVDVISMPASLTDDELRAAPVPVSVSPSATATVTSVADNAASVPLLAANSARRGAIVANDSSARLFVKMGATASATSYSQSLAQYQAWEVPFGYTGRLDGIWASDPGDGGARVTELTA